MKFKFINIKSKDTFIKSKDTLEFVCVIVRTTIDYSNPSASVRKRTKTLEKDQRCFLRNVSWADFRCEKFRDVTLHAMLLCMSVASSIEPATPEAATPKIVARHQNTAYA